MPLPAKSIRGAKLVAPPSMANGSSNSEPPRPYVRAVVAAGLAPGGDGVALGADRHARPQRAGAGLVCGADVQRRAERRPCRAGQPGGAHVATGLPDRVADLVDAHV